MADAAGSRPRCAGCSRATRRSRLEIAGGFERPPLERTAGVARLYEQARQVAAGARPELDEGSTGGGSDGNFTAALGVPTLDGLGPEGTARTRCTSTSLLDRPALARGVSARP